MHRAATGKPALGPIAFPAKYIPNGAKVIETPARAPATKPIGELIRSTHLSLSSTSMVSCLRFFIAEDRNDHTGRINGKCGRRFPRRKSSFLLNFCLSPLDTRLLPESPRIAGHRASLPARDLCRSPPVVTVTPACFGLRISTRSCLSPRGPGAPCWSSPRAAS